MALSTRLKSQFAKTMSASDVETNTKKTLMGTAVEYSGEIYVQLDGSDQLTPLHDRIAGVKDGDRVTIEIENHSASLTGNLSDPAAGTTTVAGIENQVEQFNVIIANKADIDQLEAAEALIGQLQAEDVTITGKLEAVEADIGELEADNVVINENLQAQSAQIEVLQTTKLDTETAEITYANIDFTNIGMAAVEELFAKSGIIEDMVVGDQHITGHLVGVTISGDLIEGNTIKADKLVVLGEDGLYYKLNVNAETVAAEQTEYNSISGTIITAHTITAEKVNVDDLVAFDATIGGFHINDHAIYSGVKESINNTTNGIYMGSDGQIYIGDSNDYLRYFKDADTGQWKLAISARSITIGSGGQTIEEALEDMQEQIDNVEVGGVEVGARNLIRNSKTLIFEEYILSLPKYSIEVHQTTGGTIGVSATSAEPNSTITVTITPNSLYDFASGGVYKASDDTLYASFTLSAPTFTMPEYDVYVSAVFQEVPLSLTDDGNGTVTIHGATLSDDGSGNITINGALLQSDGNGNITIS